MTIFYRFAQFQGKIHAAGGSALFLVVAYWVSRGVSQPIEALARSAQRIAHRASQLVLGTAYADTAAVCMQRRR
ncbi:MAG TPA: hypothetical protein VIF60_15425 [Burkholderiaceae bacterium]|jgi:hypothetical protein